MSYAYTNGDGLSALDSATPDGATEPMSNADDAIRQIKAYLKDPIAGPKALIDALQASLFPAGLIAPYGVATAPTGWLICDGSAVSRTTYSTLFAAIGVTFGAGDGSTTFNLPDMRGRAPVGTGTGDASGATAWALANKKGAETHTLADTEIPPHTHTVGKGESGGWSGCDSSVRLQVSCGGSCGNVTSSSSGGGQAHNNLQPSLGLTFIIKT